MPFQGVGRIIFKNPGRCPGLNFCRTFGAKCKRATSKRSSDGFDNRSLARLANRLADALGARVNIEAILTNETEHAQAMLASQAHCQARRGAHGCQHGDAGDRRFLHQFKLARRYQ